MIDSGWPRLVVYARDSGVIDPYDARNAHLFRGEEAFAEDVIGWPRWSKPSPEPFVDGAFRKVLLDSVKEHAEVVSVLVDRTAHQIIGETTDAPLLVAILRAGVPVALVLAARISEWTRQEVPVAALSLFHGLGWDECALDQALRDHPGRPVWFVDGWTGGGGVARELRAAHGRWLDAGREDFTRGDGPRLAVLCDPGGYAHARGTRSDVFIPSSCFTAPETLGFSRGFVNGDKGMFRVYRFGNGLIDPRYIRAWLRIGTTESDLSESDGAARILAEDDERASLVPQLPEGWRFYVNEVARALINRSPTEVFFHAQEGEAVSRYGPVVELCTRRGVPMVFGVAGLARWRAAAAARMSGTPDTNCPWRPLAG